eukprot:7203054-Prymnesium_polylepis.1
MPRCGRYVDRGYVLHLSDRNHRIRRTERRCHLALEFRSFVPTHDCVCGRRWERGRGVSVSVLVTAGFQATRSRPEISHGRVMEECVT